MMRGIEVAELVLLAVVLLLAAALILQYYLRLWGSTNKPCSSELPLSRPNSCSATTKQSRLLLLLLKKMLCSGRLHARVEPAEASPSEAEDVARWFRPASRALYTIEEEAEDEERSTSTSTSTDRDEERPSPSEPETPFYTPPVSPHRLAAQSP